MKLICGDFGPQPRRRQGVFDACDLLSVGALDLRAQFGHAGCVLRVNQRDGLYLQHLQVFGSAALLSVEILETPDGFAVGGVTADRMGQISFCTGDIGKVVDAYFRS